MVPLALQRTASLVAGAALLSLTACSPPSVVALGESRASLGAVEVSVTPHAVGGERLLTSCTLILDGEVQQRVALLAAPEEGQRFIAQVAASIEPADIHYFAAGSLLVDVQGGSGRTLAGTVELVLDSVDADATFVSQRLMWGGEPRALEGDEVFLLPNDPTGRPTRLEPHPDLADLDGDPQGFLRELLKLHPGLADEL